MDTYIITGFLGSGKTELLNQMIEFFDDKKIVIIENEVADFGVDGKVSKSKKIEVIEINDGSISTVNLDNFRNVLKKVLKKKIDVLLIETSGAVNLKPVLVVMHERKLAPVVIAVVDAERFSNAKKLSSHTLGHVSNSSLVILNKEDLVNKKTLQLQLRNLKLLNKEVITTTKCKIKKEDIQNLRPIILNKKIKLKKQSELSWKLSKHWKTKSIEKHKNINAYVYEGHGIVDEKKLVEFFEKNNIPRAKGFVFLEDKKMHYFSTVGKHFTKEDIPAEPKKRINQIVLIGENMYVKRQKYKSILRGIIKRTLKDKLSDIGNYVQNQQRDSRQVVKLN